MFALIFAQAVESLSGGAGWVGAGLLGAVLAWLMFVHLPAKDKQISSIIEVKDKQIGNILADHAVDRANERTERHDRANGFQKVLNDTTLLYREQLREIHSEHVEDAERDRTAFLSRSADIGNTMRLAIEKQTLELEKAIKASCMFQPNHAQNGGGVIRENMGG